MQWCVCYFVVFLFQIVNRIQSCGVTTHTEIAHRAARFFDYALDNNTSLNKIIKQYQSAFQAGNPYPDAMYPSQCKKGTLNSVAEDTHWVPFLNATINYIRRTYKKPYNEDALQLIVFTLGFVSHQMADVTWHSLDINQGFLSAMGYGNFHGSFSAAHSVGDTGGDVVNQFELEMSYIADLGDWYVPYKDLYHIYKEYYGEERVTQDDIIECSSLLFLARLGEQLAISLLYTNFANKSPFLTHRLNDYFLGGIDDMATWTQISWKKTLYMLENGVDKCQLNHNILYVDCENMPQAKVKAGRKTNKLIEDAIQIFDLNRVYLTKSFTSKGVYFRPSKIFEGLMALNKIDVSVPSLPRVRLHDPKYQYSNTTYFTTREYANAGWSLAVGQLNSDGNDDLVIGAPVYSFQNSYQNGRVFIKLAKNATGLPLHDVDLDENSDFILDSPDAGNSENSRFGHAITILDLDLDGHDDVVVSAPSYGLKNLTYQGRVYVYLSGSPRSFQQPSITITCDQYTYCNNGWLLSKGDVNGDGTEDLIIGSPYASTCGDQCGFVAVLFSTRQYIPPTLSISKLNWLLLGSMQYEWFGFSGKAKNGYLAVGAPQSRICHLADCSMNDQDIQAVGRVYVYKYPATKPVVILNGTENFEQFGYDLDLSKNSLIAISSVTKDSKLNHGFELRLKQGGIVQVFDLTSPTAITVIKSDRPYADFGSKLKFDDLNSDGSEDLLIGAQLRSESLLMVNKVEEGIVYMFDGSKNFKNGNITDDCPATYTLPCTDLKASAIFVNTESKTRFGSNIEIIRQKSSNNVQLAISAARSDSFGSRLSGQILLFSLKK